MIHRVTAVPSSLGLVMHRVTAVQSSLGLVIHRVTAVQSSMGIVIHRVTAVQSCLANVTHRIPQRRNSRCRITHWSIHSLPRGVATPGDDYSVQQLGLQEFIISCSLIFFHIHSFRPVFLLCLSVLFRLCCAHAHVLGTTFLYEVLIFYRNTECE